jgi:hypothetical protein
MTDMKNPYRRSLDPENDSLILWVIATGLILIVLVSGLLYVTTRAASDGTRTMQQSVSLNR